MILLKSVFLIAIVAVAMIGVMVPSVFAIDIASFVDQTKDPQHYIDRYNNEPAYKEWFDENYPQYSSIYEAVGLDQEDYELKIKANDIRKLINENYVPTSSELDSKWLWVSSGGTDGYSEYCLTLNCDGYSHTTYRPVRDVVNWDQHLELTILFFEDGDNSFDTHTEVQCEDQGYFDCGRVYPNYQCVTPNANYDLREAKRNLTCQSEYFNIIIKEKKTDCDEMFLDCGDFENHSADMMKVVLEKIAKNSNVELINNVESTIAYTPEPEYVPEPVSDEVTINFQIDSQYSLYEIIRIEGEVSKIIPNTPITYQFSTDVDRFTKTYEIFYPHEPHLDQNGKFHMTIEYYECDDCTSGDVHLEFFYGQPDNHLASIEKSFYVDNKISKTSEKIQNYFPTDKYEIGTDVNFRERVPDLISPDPLASHWGSIWYESKLNPQISISYFENGDHIPTGKLQHQKYSLGCHSPSLQECQNFNLHDFECVSVSSYSSSHEICENEYYQIFENYGKKKVNFGETGGFYMNKIIDNIVENPLEIDPELQCGSGTTYKDGQCVVDEKEGGGCLIATATYGSEMSNEVQQLRELRDNQLMNTESGTAFMGTFNDVYYSFSPIIADYERENPLFKEAVKLAITPMLSSLSLMENANSESEVLSIGISVILLNLGMYLGVPAALIVGIKKIK